MDHEQLIGASVEFVYADETYRIDVVGRDRLHWTRTVGEDTGRGDDETYLCSELDDDVLMLTWIEADGLGLSHVLDFGVMSLTTHANVGREVFVNPGRLRHVDR